MLNLNNNATNVKKELLIKLTKLQLDGKLDTKEINHIPKEIAPRTSLQSDVVFFTIERF